MKVTVIANPISGGGKGEKLLKSYSSAMEAHGHNISRMVTEKPGDAEKFAGKIEANTDMVAIIGGDGTVAEVLNGLNKVDVFPLLSIPAGTANILCKELGISSDIGDLVKISEMRRVVMADAGQASFRSEAGDNCSKRFLLVGSAGFDSWVTREVKRRRKGALGYIGYAVPILRSIFSYQFPKITVTVGKKQISGYMAVIGNTRNYGGLFSITADADMDSGVFDVCVMKRRGRIAMAYYSLLALCKRLGKCRSAEFITAREILLEADQEMPVQLDGDYVGLAPLKISMLPDKVPLVYNSKNK